MVVMLLCSKETVVMSGTSICKIDSINNVHHVHVWQLNEEEIHLEAHVDFDKDITISEFDLILVKIEEDVFHNFGINHVNIQPEYGKCESDSVITQD